MDRQELDQKLAAMLYADVAGYSRLTSEDEHGTHRTLTACLDIFTQAIERNRGKVVHYAGDAVLAEFGAVADAVTCAVAVQRDLKARNHELPEERKLQFRIGINLGDVIVDRDDIYGDGVNVAARLETLADPGGICISRSVYEQVKSKLELGYEHLGEQRLKNIADPVEVYRLHLEPEAVGTDVGKKTTKSRRSTVVAVIILLVGVGAAVWLQPWAPDLETASVVDRTALPLPDKPSIAVLPFDDLSGDHEQEYFADGMTEDLITDLSKLSGLFVIARNSSFAYKGKSPDVREVSRELGVRYLLEGSVRRAGDEVRINAQLIDATTGGHLWAERYDGTLSDVFALQDEVTQQIVTALAVNLTAKEQSRRTNAQTDNPAAYDAFLQGWAHYIRQTPEAFAKAIPYFERAVSLDPNYGRAYAALASGYYFGRNRGWHEVLGLSHTELTRGAYESLQKALAHPTPLAYAVASNMDLQNGRHNEAIVAAERAIELDPNNPSGHIAMAHALIYIGNPEKAIVFVETAMRLDPHYPPAYLLTLAMARFGMEQFEDATALFERASNRSPELIGPGLVAAYAHSDRTQEAAAVLERLKARQQERFPAYPLTIRDVMHFFPFKEDADAERLADGLRKAGLK